MDSENVAQRLALLEGSAVGTLTAHRAAVLTLLTCIDPSRASIAIQLLDAHARIGRKDLFPEMERYFDSAVEEMRAALERAAQDHVQS